MELRLLNRFLFVVIFLQAVHFQLIAQGDEAINISQTEGCAPFSVDFHLKKENVRSCLWSFSNGVSSNSETPSVIFDVPGSYNVSVVIIYKDNTQEKIALSNAITVNELPTVDLNISHEKICQGDTVEFTNLSTNASTYIWDFGDGGNSTAFSPRHAYSDPGKYSVTLIARSGNGCTSVKSMEDILAVHDIPKVDFISDEQDLCKNQPIATFNSTGEFETYHWDFGDGTISNNKSEEHVFKKTGTYTISLAVFDKNGCHSQISKTDYISVHTLQDLSLSISDTIICEGQPIDVQNNTKNTDSVAWSINGAYVSSGNAYQHLFADSGSHQLKVAHWDNYGCVQEQEQLIHVKGREKDNIYVSEFSGCAPTTIRFENNTGDGIGYKWEIGDTLIDQKAFYLVFDDSLSAQVKVATTHKSGCTSELVLDNRINIRRNTITASVSEISGCQPFQTSFQLSELDIEEVKWNFGDDNYSNKISPNHTYELAGTYYPEVYFKGSNGCEANIKFTDPVVVFDTLINYEKGTIHLCPHEDIRFSGDVGKGIWKWNFGDGTTSNKKNPLHTFKVPGEHKVSLVTENRNGCMVTLPDYYRVIVSNLEPVDFEVKMGDCLEQSVYFHSPAIEGVNYYWNFGDGTTDKGVDVTHKFSGGGSYLINQTIKDKYGCQAIKAKNITLQFESCVVIDRLLNDSDGEVVINPPEFPERYIPVVEACAAPFQYTFQKLSLNAKSVEWDFKDGNRSNEFIPTHTFTQPGVFDVDLIYTTAEDKIDTILSVVRIIVKDQQIGLSYAITSHCEGASVLFDASKEEGIVSWNWDFGDGETSTEARISKTYHQSDIFQIQLNTTDSIGCTKRTVQNISIGNPNPIIDFPKDQCLGDSFRIDHNIDGFAKYLWDFGDGKISDQKFPSHQYDLNGAYALSLQVVDESNCEKKFEVASNVNIASPKAMFTFDSDSVGCHELEVKFRNLSLNADRWLWEFGNGLSSCEKHPRVVFGPGIFTITLTAYKAGCIDQFTKVDAVIVSDLQADFSMEQEHNCSPVEVKFNDESSDAKTWKWLFGDGDSSTEQNPVHIFNEIPKGKVTLVVTDRYGCSAKKIGSKPDFYKTKFKAKNSMGCIPYEASFEDMTKGSVQWDWDFGNGDSSEEQHPQVNYIQPGEYTVRLITTSEMGCKDTAIVENVVKVGVLSTNFSVEFPESLCSPLLATFSDKSTGADQYQWDFGDGSYSKLRSPIHIYSKVGQFDVKLMTENEFGCKDTIVYESLVKTLGPEAHFEISDSVMCFPTSFTLMDKSKSAVQWEWYFGDGKTSQLPSPEYEYDSPGTYTVALLATDSYGCSEFIKRDSIRVIQTPKAKFEIDNYEFCLLDTVKVINQSSGFQSPVFYWTSDSIELSQKAKPVFIFREPGEFPVHLKIVNEATCSASYSLSKPLQIRDTFHLREPHVTQLSVNAADEIEILFDPYSKNNLKYHIVYRKAQNEEQYHLIDSIFDPSTSFYLDHGVTTDAMDYRYKIQTHSYCNTEDQLDNLNTYKSIYLSREVHEEGIKLFWTPYLGNEFQNYSILRRDSDQEWLSIDHVAKSHQSYLDTEDLCPREYEYRIKADHLDGGDYHSLSNKVLAKPLKNVFADQQVELIRTSVIGDDLVLTEWHDTAIGPDKVLCYDIMKSVNGEAFSFIDRVPKGANSFVDEDVETDEFSYQYKISVINSCNVIGLSSNLGTSILLQKETSEYQNHLNWTIYNGWGSGVQHYLLQKMDPFGNWETIEIIPSEFNSIDIDLSQFE